MDWTNRVEILILCKRVESSHVIGKLRLPGLKMINITLVFWITFLNVFYLPVVYAYIIFNFYILDNWSKTPIELNCKKNISDDFFLWRYICLKI